MQTLYLEIEKNVKMNDGSIERDWNVRRKRTNLKRRVVSGEREVRSENCKKKNNNCRGRKRYSEFFFLFFYLFIYCFFEFLFYFLKNHIFIFL